MEQKLYCPDVPIHDFKLHTPNVHAFITEPTTPLVGPLVAKTSGFVDKTSRQMGNDFLTRLDRYQRIVRNTDNSAIGDFLVERNLHLPQFALFDSITAGEFLGEAGYVNEGVDYDSLLMVFQFPKPLAQFWKRRNMPYKREELSAVRIKRTFRDVFDSGEITSSYEHAIDILAKPPTHASPRAIEWGKFISSLRKIIWDNIDLYSQQSHELEFQKINGNGEHDVDLYHYMWEVSFPEVKHGKNGK